MDSSSLVLFVNGKKVVVKRPDPETTLVQFLRQTCGLTGTKIGCNQGGCGACTVMLSKYDHLSQQIKHYTVNSCLTALLSCHGLAVTTVEGIGNTKDGLHAVQERLAKSHGTQCGFCSPGFVMSMYALLRNNSKPSQDQIEVAVRGNLCRCTGYRPILDGFSSFASSEAACPMGTACCRNKDKSTTEDTKVEIEAQSDKFIPYDPTQDPIFPPELKAINTSAKSRSYQGQRTKWFSPITIDELLELRNQHQESVLVCGNTSLAVGTTAKESHQKVVISTNDIPEFHQMSVTTQGLWCGAAVTISQLEQEIHRLLQSEDKQKTRVLKALIDILKFYACTQIKNLASVVGNLFIGKQSDIIPLFIAGGAKIKVVFSADKIGKEIILTEELYRKNPSLIEAGEVITGITIPYSDKTSFYIACKQGERQHMNFAIINAGMKVTINNSLDQIEDLKMIFGGESRLIDLSAVSSQLIGRSWNSELLKEAMRLIGQEMSSLDIAGFTKDTSVQYKASLAETFFYKLFCSVNDSLKNQTMPESVTSYNRSETKQDHGTPAKNEGDCFKPIPHTSSQLHTSGEAVYVADIPHQSGELQLSLVLSTVAHADIISIDTTEALAVPGVKGYVSAADVPGSNDWDGELVFNDKTVLCVGQVIGAIVAETKLQAQIAAKLVKVKYEEKPAIFTIQEAIEKNSYLILKKPAVLSRGDVDTALTDCDHVIEAEMYCGGQEHFYMETQCALTVPQENRVYEIHSATQLPMIMQSKAAGVLNVAVADVTVKVKRVGGAFGGKQLRALLVTLPTAVAANKFGVPVRCVLDRDEDMLITGKRTPLLAKYKVGFASDGIIKALDVQLYTNAGCATDVSESIIQKALLSIESGYHLANMKVSGQVCKTNLPAFCPMRGLTSPQVILIMDSIVRDVAGRVSLPLHEVQQKNFCKEGENTLWGQQISDISNLERCYNKIMTSSDYVSRLDDVMRLNRENNRIKRGISIQPMKYGLGFFDQFLNQAGALVNIYTDGHVLISHGGAEIGQGIHTKMIQIASEALGIPTSKIRLHDTSTDKVPNSILTAASATTMLNGSAVLNACEILNKRLEPVKQMMPGAPWEQCVGAAFMMRISLSAVGFYSTPDITSLDWEGTGTGLCFTCWSYGAAVSEVEVDCITGSHKVLRSDVVVDVGKSINPAIDVGQIEGAFIQGYGLFCMEDVQFDENGVTLNTGPGSYKIPMLNDVPKQFNVSLLEDSVNDKAIYGSKAIGEPPVSLAGSVFFAIKSAIESAREATGMSKEFRFDSPLTCEKVRLACPKEIKTD